MIKDKAGLLGLGKLKRGIVEFAGEQIEIRELSAGERDRVNVLVRQNTESKDPNWFAVNGLVMVLGCDIVSEDDLDEVMAGSYEMVEAIADAISRLSGMTEDEEAKKD